MSVPEIVPCLKNTILGSSKDDSELYILTEDSSCMWHASSTTNSLVLLVKNKTLLGVDCCQDVEVSHTSGEAAETFPNTSQPLVGHTRPRLTPVTNKLMNFKTEGISYELFTMVFTFRTCIANIYVCRLV